MRHNSTWPFWLIAAAVLLVMAVRQAFPPAAAEADGRPMPPLMAEGWLNAAGPPSPESLRGKLVVIDAWATWCGFCVEGTPKLIELNRRFGDQVTLIGLTPERGSQAEDVRAFIDVRDGMDWPVGYGAQPTLDALGLRGFPTFFLFGRDGRLRWQGHTLAQLEEEVVQALAQQ